MRRLKPDPLNLVVKTNVGKQIIHPVIGALRLREASFCNQEGAFRLRESSLFYLISAAVEAARKGEANERGLNLLYICRR